MYTRSVYKTLAESEGGQYYPPSQNALPVSCCLYALSVLKMPREPQASQFVAWIFVLNNYTDVEVEAIKTFVSFSCSYGCFGKEVGENGTPHLQGYFKLRKRDRLSHLKNTVSSRAHFESARGGPWSNRVYCSKDGDFWEYGTTPTPPRKTRDDIARDFKVAFFSGPDAVAEFAADQPAAILYSGHNLVRNAMGFTRPLPRPDISVEWIWGPPGVGKSRTAHERFPGGFVKEPRTKWWSGYMLEKEVIIDDFASKGIDINHLLRWFDRYPCWVESKGGMVPLLADKFVVTSNFAPEDCFTADDGGPHPQLAALRRRIHVTHMLQYYPVPAAVAAVVAPQGTAAGGNRVDDSIVEH